VFDLRRRALRRAGTLTAIAFAFALCVAANHRHEARHSASETQCAVCAVAHHSPTVAVADASIAAPVESFRAHFAPAEVVSGRAERVVDRGRAPPLELPA